MTGSASIDDAGIEAGLDLLGRRPTGCRPSRTSTACAPTSSAPSPSWRPASCTSPACKFKRARIVDGTYTSLCRLKIEDRDGGSSHDVDVHGVLVLPGMDAPAAPATRNGFAE